MSADIMPPRQVDSDGGGSISGAASQAKQTLRDQLRQRSSQAAEQINQQASDLRAVSESLREQDKEAPARAAERAAAYAENVGGYLRDSDPDRLLADVEDFGRRQPWAVAAGGLALGFVTSRFLKASSSRRYQAASTSAAADAESEARPQAPVGNGAGIAGPSVPPSPSSVPVV